MTAIEYYFAPHSPWTYLGHRLLGEIAARAGRDIVMKPCDLAQVFSLTGGLPLAKRAPARQAYRLTELARWPVVRQRALNLHPKHFPVDPKPASLTIIAAQQRLPGATAFALADAIMTAVWAQERDISQPDTLRLLCEQVGVDPALAQDPGAASEQTYARNTEQAIEHGVFGAPWYRVDDQNFWGQDRLELLEQTLVRP